MITVHDLRKNLKLLQGQQTDTEMALQIGSKSPWTWRRRKENPLSLKLEEVQLLAQRYRLSVVDIIGRNLLKG